MSKPIIKLDIWSDLACPWCYVGKQRLDKAMAAYTDKAEFRVEWHAYMIDPATKPEGEEYLAYNRRRWGGDGWTQDLRRSGVPDGATFSNWKWWPNTLKRVFIPQPGGNLPAMQNLQIHAAGVRICKSDPSGVNLQGHRLVQLASTQGKGHQANALLFHKSYEQGGNISRTAVLVEAVLVEAVLVEAVLVEAVLVEAVLVEAVLVEAGRELGLEGDVAAYLEGEGGLREVMQDDATGKKGLGISGVPYFIVGGSGSTGDPGQQYALPGAQPVKAFLSVFDKAVADGSQLRGCAWG